MQQQYHTIDVKTLSVIIIPIATLLITSSWFSAEIMTSFDVDVTYQDKSDKLDTITLQNTGLIQAKDVVAHIQFDSDVIISDTYCVEGDVSYIKDKLSIDLARMSTNIPCMIEFPETGNHTITDIVITSDNRSAVYPMLKEYINHMTTVFLYYVGVLLLEILLILYILRVTYDQFLQIRSWNYNKIKCREKIKTNIKETHGIKINYYDVSILCSIVHGNETISQISVDTKISKTYIRRRISFLQKNDILLPDGIRAYLPIENSIKNICKYE